MRQQAAPSRRTGATVPVRAAIYARVSSDQQAERHTIDSQVRELLHGETPSQVRGVEGR